MGAPSSIIIGYKYSLGMHMIMCQTPPDNNLVLLETRAGNRVIYDTPVTASGPIFVDKPELFGGRKKEGGVSGTIDVMMGEATQAKNSYLISQLGPNIPAFRGVFSLVLNKVYVTAMSQYPKPWSVLVRAIPQATFNPTKADIGGAANPANMLLDILTNEQLGLGTDISNVDVAAFTAASDTLFDEGFGMSWAIVGQDTAHVLIQTLMTYINGVFYTSPEDGRFTVTLIRDDYDVGTLSTYDESNVIKLNEFQRASYGEMINEVVVTYTPQGSSESDAVSVQDLAGIKIQNGIISQTFDYPAIDNATLAAKVASRDLKQKSTPLASAKITVNRSAFNEKIGGVIKFSWARLGIVSIVFRIVGIDYGNFDKGEIVLTLLEDVFGMPNASYLDPDSSGWVEPLGEPEDPFHQFLVESTYYQVIGSSVDGAFAEYGPSTAFFRLSMIEPDNSEYINFQMYRFENLLTDQGHSVEGESEFSVTGVLATTMPKTVDDIVVTLSSIQGPLAEVRIDEICYVGDELCAILDVNAALNQVTLGRGVVDTVPVLHGLGARVWFIQHRSARSRLELLVGETYVFRGVTRTGVGALAFDDATPHTVIADGRYDKPYRPGNLTVNGLSYPDELAGDSITIAWSPRNRTTEQDTLVPYVDAVTSEPGVLYDVEVWGTPSEMILEDDAYASTSFTITPANDVHFQAPAALVRDVVDDAGAAVVQEDEPRMSTSYDLNLRSVRGGVYCHQTTVHSFAHRGWGLDYGFFYGGL